MKKAGLILAICTALIIVSCTGVSNSQIDESVTVSGGNTDYTGIIAENIPAEKESVSEFSEKIEAYEKLNEEYWEGYEKEQSDWSRDPHTEEQRKEYEAKEREILAHYPESILSAVIEKQCSLIRDKDIGSIVDTLNMDCIKYYEMYYGDMKGVLPDKYKDKDDELEKYLKEEYANKFSNIVKNGSESLEWPDEIKSADLIVSDTELYTRFITSPGDPTVTLGKEYIISSVYCFKLKSSDIMGEVQVFQSADHGDLIYIKKLSSEQEYMLNNLNDAARLAFSVCNNYMSDKLADGVTGEDLINSGAFAGSASSSGLRIEISEGLGEGDKNIVYFLLEGGNEGYTVYIKFRESDHQIEFAQAVSDKYSDYIGQYPEPTVPEDKGRMMLGQFNDHNS